MKKLIPFYVLMLVFICSNANADEFELGYARHNVSINTAFEDSLKTSTSADYNAIYLNYEGYFNNSNFFWLGNYLGDSSVKKIGLGFGCAFSDSTKFVALVSNNDVDYNQNFKVNENEAELYVLKSIAFNDWQFGVKFGGTMAKGDYLGYKDVTTVGILFEPALKYEFNANSFIKLAYTYKTKGTDDKYEESSFGSLLSEQKQIARDIDIKTNVLSLSLNTVF